MYETFYHLSTNPFRLTPDPKFCFAHASHSQARAYLEYALKLGEGFIMVTGRPGTGKTTLIEAFIKQLEMNEVVAERIAASNLEPTELLRAVAYAYGIDAEGLDKATLRRRIQQFFTQQVQSGRRVLLIIDEAQGLAHPALEELRLLADLQAGSRPLLQLFLVGQDSLRDLMCSHGMEQFQQRVIGTCHLKPLDLRDTRGYVEHRLRQANWKGDPEMTGEAIVAIYQHSQGVPRHINKTCTRLLLHGLLEGKHRLDRADVLTVARELRAEQLGPLELNQADVADEAEPVPASELQDGPRSLDELALRADSVEVERPCAPARLAADADVKPAERRAAARPRQPASQQPRQRKPAKKPAGWWSNVVVLGHELLRLGTEIARKLDGRLQWPGGLAAKLGALAAVTLSIAALTTHSDDDASGHKALLTMHSELTEGRPAQPGYTENIGAVPRQPKPAPTVAEAPVPGPMSPLPESRQVTLASDEERQQVTVNDGDPVAALSPARHVRAPAPQDAVMPDEYAAAKEPMGETNDVTMPAAALAALVPATDQASSQPGSTDDGVTPVPVSLEQKIDELLSLGRQALSEDRLLIPSDNNAHQYFQQVLVLEPGNAEASDGIEKIVTRYILFAESALEREDEKKAKQYIGRGLRVGPADKRLLVLQERMNTWLARLELEAMQLPVASAPPPPAAEQSAPLRAQPRGKPQDFISRLKAFFSQGQREDQSNQIRGE